MSGSTVLEVERITLRFGGLAALSDVGFTVPSGEVVGLIGPNGAGKTALLNCITSFYLPDQGRIRLHGKDITTTPTASIARMGLGRTFQHAASMRHVGAREVMLLGCEQQLPRGVTRYLINRMVLDAERSAYERCRQIAADIGILRYIEEDTAFENLPYGVRKLVDLGRALAASPRLLLMDEPAAGLSASEKATMIDVIRGIRDRHEVSLVVVDHDLDFVSALAANLVVLDAGRKIADGPVRDVLAMPEVIESYIGRGREEAAS